MPALLPWPRFSEAGELGHVQWLRTGWWGILGLIGWGYLVSSVSFLLAGERLGANILITLFFVVLNIFSQLGWLSFLDFAKPVFGIIIDGNVPVHCHVWSGDRSAGENTG
ncbi:MAG: hypothetical protein AB2L24_23140 [Mangrovibacterium sp.]